MATLLLYSGRTDRRAWSLGLFILDSASTLTEPFVLTVRDTSPLIWTGLHIRTDAFQAAMIWFFAGEFPRPSTSPRLVAVFRRATFAAFALGVSLAVMDAVAVASSESAGGALLALARSVQRSHSGGPDWYFLSQFLLVAPLLVLQRLKLREWGPDDRRRFAWLVLGIAIGYTPMIALTALVAISPETWVRMQPHARLYGAIDILALTLVPLSAAYAGLVQRTLSLRVILRAALQHLLARSVIQVLAALPVVAFVALVFANRERSVTELLSGTRGLTIAALAVIGLSAAALNRRLLVAIDRGFFREQFDARRILLDVADQVRRASSVQDLCATLTSSLDQALHPSSILTAVSGPDGDLYSQGEDIPPLRRRWALAQLAEGGDMPLEIDDREGSVLSRLSRPERDWLQQCKARLLVPLRGSGGQLLGTIALADKKSELPFTQEDRALLTAAGSAGGLALDRVLTSERLESKQGPQNVPPARECLECGAVLDADSLACACGGLVQRALVPRVLDDYLRFEKRVGAGAMGVVYQARDLRLQQIRAVKTLPSTDPALVARLRREARLMAATTHANLASIYALEIWRGSPLLVMEYLDGGTLAERLRGGSVPIPTALDWGAKLADALGSLHGGGLLHRDVKPSNIGFTSTGVPKLLDFGLAKLLPGASTSPVPADDGGSTWSATFSTQGFGIRGTPAYMSPELLMGAEPRAADDLWSLSVTLLEACTGRNPFKADTGAATVSRVLTEWNRAADYASHLAPEIHQLFSSLLGEQSRRPQIATAMAAQLRALGTKEG